MIALLKKEAEALLPYAAAFGVLVAVNVLRVLWDADLLHDGFGLQRSDGSSQSATMWFLGFLVGHGVVAHELRDGHVEFLDGLPTSRWTVFSAKVATSFGLMTALAAASLAMDLGFAWLAPPPQAMDPAPSVLLTNLLMLLAGWAGLGVGMLLSWVGSLAWGILALGGMVAACAGLAMPPVQAWIPVTGSIGTLEWDGASATHPVGPPLLHLVLGGLLVLVSGVLFSGPGRFLTTAGAGGLSVVRGGLVGCAGLLAAPIVALFAGVLAFQAGPELWAGKRALPAGSFRILYRPGDEARAEALAAEVEDLSRQVGDWVGATEPLALDLELLGAPTHHLGVFTGGKIRLAQSAERGVLAHELTHAHAFQLAGRATWDQGAHTHFFEEGLADWVRARILGHDPVPPVAGAVYATGQARFEELVDSNTHLARHDIAQSYLLGQVFAVALVDVAGPDAPGCLLRTLGDTPPATDAPGLALWYGLAARCDFDLDAVQDRWIALLEEARTRIPGPLPELRAHLVPETPALVVTDTQARGWPLHCGFRDEDDLAAEHWVYLQADDDGACAIPTKVLSGHSFQYQVGYAVPDELDRPVVFLPWTDARTP